MDKNTSHGLSRRGLLRAAGTTAAAAALAGAGSREALAAQELRIMMPGGSWKDFVDKTFATPFAKANNAEIVWKLGLSMEPIIMAQQRRPQWDLVHTAQSRAEQLGSMGLYRAWKAEEIPNLPKIHPSFRYEFLAGKCHTPYGLCVNTKQIKRPITSWTDMWDPAFKGKVAFPAWNWTGDEVFQAINIVLGGAADNIDVGIAKFKTLFKDNDCQIINNVEHTRQLLLAGEVWLCPYFSARTEQAAAAGAPVEFVIPTEGGISWIFNTAMVANRPKESMELAQKFVNLELDADKQIEFARLTGYPPTNMDAMKNLPPDLAKLKYSEDELVLLGKLQRQADYMVQFAYRDQFAERWNKEVLAAK
jgi:putative spermidine/putrescine transport system substrate-binding protein